MREYTISAAYETPLCSDSPWHFTTKELSPINIPQLWTLGSNLSLMLLRACELKAYPNFDEIELLNAFLRFDCIILAVPSAVLSAMLPENPSVTTTLVFPKDISLPSTNPK